MAEGKQQYDNTNSGVAFKKESRPTENHPSYTGHLNVNGTEFWLSVWIKAGGQRLSLAITPKEKKPEIPF